MDIDPQNAERRRRLRAVALVVAWTMLWAVLSPATLLLAAFGLIATKSLGLAMMSAVIGGAAGLAIAPFVAASMWLRGRVSFRAVTAACLCGFALLCALLRLAGLFAVPHLRELPYLLLWPTIILLQAWGAYWVALEIPRLRALTGACATTEHLQ